MVCSEIGISCIQLWASSQTLFCVICFEHFVYIPAWQFFTPSKLGVHLSRTYVFSCLDELSSEMSYYISSQFLFGHTSLCSLVLWTPHCISLRSMWQAFGKPEGLSSSKWHKPYAAAIITEGQLKNVIDQAEQPGVALNFNPVLQNSDHAFHLTSVIFEYIHNLLIDYLNLLLGCCQNLTGFFKRLKANSFAADVNDVMSTADYKFFLLIHSEIKQPCVSVFEFWAVSKSIQSYLHELLLLSLFSSPELSLALWSERVKKQKKGERNH